MTTRLARGTAAALLLVLTGPALSGCAAADGGPAAASSAPRTSAADGALPASAAELEELLLDEVPSGLPRVPDDELDPPAGEKTVDDVARYGGDAQRQEEVLAEYGYQRGWERFWRAGDELTSVFVDQFDHDTGAVSYAEDLARNDAEYYGSELDRSPSGLPGDCVLMLHGTAPEHGLAGPAAFAWCARGDFTVAVAAVATSEDAARAELEAVTTAQLERLPTG